MSPGLRFRTSPSPTRGQVHNRCPMCLPMRLARTYYRLQNYSSHFQVRRSPLITTPEYFRRFGGSRPNRRHYSHLTGKVFISLTMALRSRLHTPVDRHPTPRSQMNGFVAAQHSTCYGSRMRGGCSISFNLCWAIAINGDSAQLLI